MAPQRRPRHQLHRITVTTILGRHGAERAGAAVTLPLLLSYTHFPQHTAGTGAPIKQNQLHRAQAERNRTSVLPSQTVRYQGLRPDRRQTWFLGLVVNFFSFLLLKTAVLCSALGGLHPPQREEEEPR